MALQELREEWRQVKDKPRDNPERIRLEQDMFYAFHQAVTHLERTGVTVFSQREGIETSKQGRDKKR